MLSPFKHWLFALAATATLTGCLAPEMPKSTESTMSNPTEKAATNESQHLYKWFQANFEEDLADSPEHQTHLGIIDDIDAYGRWDDVSEAHFRAEQTKISNRLAYMREHFDTAALTPAARTAYRFAEFVAINSAQQAEFRDHNYVYTQLFGPHIDMVTTLISYHRIDSVEHADAYIRRLESFGQVLNTHSQHAEERAQIGVLPPLFAYPVIIHSAKGMITGAPFTKGKDSPLLADFRQKVTALELARTDEQALIGRVITALKTSVQPAYEHLIRTMEKHQSMADNRDGVWKLPRGEAYYQTQLANYTTRNDLTAEQIHQLGLAEVARIHGEMRKIMAQVNFSGSLQEFFAHLRNSEQFYYPNTEAGRQQYLAEATAMMDRVMEKAPAFFGTLPTARLKVRAVEPFRIESATGAFYEPGSLDGTRPGVYYVNLSNMRELPIYQMESLAYHEGAPGHHFQNSIAMELKNAPMFQKLTWYSAYGEGWALYAEKLGKEMGLFSDPYMDFGRLSYEVFRAARLVVDTGIHVLQWSEKQATDYMLSNTPMTAGDIENEVQRYIVLPGQAVSYKVGMLTIMELRQKAMDALGRDFDIGEFHDVVLNNGSVPLTLLRQLVDSYITQKQQLTAEDKAQSPDGPSGRT